MIAIIGTSDRLCWLAETCKILLLLLLTVPTNPWTHDAFVSLILVWQYQSALSTATVEINGMQSL